MLEYEIVYYKINIRINTRTYRVKQISSATSPYRDSSFKKKLKILCNICPDMLSFRGTRHRQAG
jgi:hypothetical protein